MEDIDLIKLELEIEKQKLKNKKEYIKYKRSLESTPEKIGRFIKTFFSVIGEVIGAFADGFKGNGNVRPAYDDIDYYNNKILELRTELINAKTATDRISIRSSIKAYEKLKQDTRRPVNISYTKQRNDDMFFGNSSKTDFGALTGMSNISGQGIREMSNIRTRRKFKNKI